MFCFICFAATYHFGIISDVVVLASSVESPAHSDFLLLRNMLVRTHMQDLKDVTRETHYENYRAQCIQSMTRMVVQERKRRWVEAAPRRMIDSYSGIKY